MGVRSVVLQPPLVPRSYGLLVSASEAPKDKNDPLDRWVNGFSWLPESCGGAGLTPVCNPHVEDEYEKITDRDNQPGAQNYDPYVAFAGFACTVQDRALSAEDRAARSIRLLNADRSRAMETEFWKGTISQDQSLENDYLQSSNTTVLNSGTAVPIRLALGQIEKAAGECGTGQKMIHMAPDMADIMTGLQMLRSEGGQLFTPLGSIVVAGAGYDGSGPSGHTSDTTWIYATSRVYFKQGPVSVLGDDPSQQINRSVNDWDVIAEQALATFSDPCCRIGIKVDQTTEL